MMNSAKIIPAAAVIIFLIWVFIFWDYSIDDAYITFRYAENLADGHGLTFNPGDPPVEAYSNFLWLLLLALFYAIGLPTVITAKILGIFFTVLTGVTWPYLFKRALINYRPEIGALFLMTPFSAFWAVSGLEFGLYVFLLIVFLSALIAGSRLTYAIIPLLILTRPEAAVIVIVAVLIFWRLNKNSAVELTPFFRRMVVSLFITVVLLTLFRLFYFGDPLPNTVYAKSTLTFLGLQRLLEGLLYLLPFTILFIFAAAKKITRKRMGKTWIVFAVLFITMAIINCLADAVMNFHFRYMVPFLPLFIYAAVSAINEMKSRTLKYSVIAACVLSLFSPVPAMIGTLKKEKRIVAAQQKVIQSLNEKPSDNRVALTDIGRIPYYTSATYNDLWGLASHDIAHDGFEPLREFTRFPDYFILVGYIPGGLPLLRFNHERQIYNFKFFQEIYRLDYVGIPEGEDIATEGYYYLMFRKNQVKLDSLLELYPLN